MRSAKIQIGLRIRAVRSESSLAAFWIAKDAKFLLTDNEDADRTAHARADLSLRWGHMSEGLFSHISAQRIFSLI